MACVLIGANAAAATITGTVFEDRNYGGSAGRSLAASAGFVANATVVELYEQATGNWVGVTTTNSSGVYTFSSTSIGTTYLVRVVNGTVVSNGRACAGCVAVQTFRTDASTGTVIVVTDHVGGENPAISDAPANTSNSNFSTLSSGGRIAQSVAVVNQTVAAIAGVDFGFNFDTIVNTRDVTSCGPSGSGTSFPCQGSLRQFIINANGFGTGAALSQAGNGQLDGSTTPLPSGNESSIFMIPSGTATPGQIAGYANQLTGGVAIITLGAALPTITGSRVRLDATTQTVNVGNTNSGTLGSGGTVGVDAIALPFFQRPEVQLNAGNRQLILSGASDSIVGLALAQGYILLSGTGCLARNNLVGMTASGDSSANTTGIGIAFQGVSSTVSNNFVTVNNSGIRTDGGGAGSLITLNEVARPTSGHTTTYDGILLVGAVSATQVTNNLARDQLGGGIEIGFGGGATASSITVSNNTVLHNGFTSGGTASTEPVGFVGYSYSTTSTVVVSKNKFINNAGAGVLLTSAYGTVITQNSFSNNGGLSIDLDPRGLDPNTMGPPQGVTLNDNLDSDAGPNGLLNYPVFVSAVLIGTDLTLTGFARPGSVIELYIAEADPTGFGEGLTYLGTITEGSAADLDATTGTYGPGAINGIAQGTDTTNRFSFRIVVPAGVVVGTRLSGTATLGGQTSEFSGNVTVTSGPVLTVKKTASVFSDPINGTSASKKSIPGAIVEYALAITNSGPVQADSVDVSDQLDYTNTAIQLGGYGGKDIQIAVSGGSTTTCTAAADADGCTVTAAGLLTIGTTARPNIPAGQTATINFRVTIK